MSYHRQLTLYVVGKSQTKTHRKQVTTSALVVILLLTCFLSRTVFRVNSDNSLVISPAVIRIRKPGGLCFMLLRQFPNVQQHLFFDFETGGGPVTSPDPPLPESIITAMWSPTNLCPQRLSQLILNVSYPGRICETNPRDSDLEMTFL